MTEGELADGSYRRGGSATQGRGYGRLWPGPCEIELYTALESYGCGFSPQHLQRLREHAAASSGRRRARFHASARGRRLGSREKCDGAKRVASVPGPDTARGGGVTLGPGRESGRAPTPTCSNMKQQSQPCHCTPNMASTLRTRQPQPMWPLPSLAAPPPAPNRDRRC